MKKLKFNFFQDFFTMDNSTRPTFEEYISDYQIVSVKNIDLLDECGITEDMLTEETLFVMVFHKGGFIECTSSGHFYLILGNCDYLDKDWKNIVKHLYEWCEGEYF